jgi:hypothetical protein
VDREFNSAAMLDIAAAITPAMNSPASPSGRAVRTNRGIT